MRVYSETEDSLSAAPRKLSAFFFETETFIGLELTS